MLSVSAVSFYSDLILNIRRTLDLTDLDSADVGFNGLNFTYSFTITFSYRVSCVSVTDL
jgi:hypothetical protein